MPRLHRRPPAGVHAAVELRLNQGGPNPDYVYLNAEVDGAGVYELAAGAAPSRFVEITQQGPA